MTEVLDGDQFAGRIPPTRELALKRLEVRGKFIFADNEKLWLRGVTYGTFAPDAEGHQFPPRHVIEQDFRDIALAGINSVRVYTAPPGWVLDLAEQYGLRMMVGLPWEQHIAFLNEKDLPRTIIKRLRGEIAHCVGHPALLCFAIGNEIPAAVVRWHGKRRVERFLGQLAAMVRGEDPDALLTYVNFPTTEYLDLPFVDFITFNVYLEKQERLAAYIQRLHNLAGERPLVMAEIGLDSLRNGRERQAEVLSWQISTVFESGCAGAFIFSWTDQWYRGGNDIDDWDFGLVTRDRQPKPALSAVSQAFSVAPIREHNWPRISVIVCSYNGAATIGETLEGLSRLEYPNFEVIVVNDGSTDTTPEIAGRFRVRLISTSNNGLSYARNVGMHAATGEIVAYTDDDAFPDPHWLHYLALSFMRTDHAAIGGPNIPPLDDNDIAQCVANAPGGPIHVLVTDELAEHIPGCNMAFRREKLLEIGGFDAQFRVAGDDVDVCWRIQEAGGTLGFNAAAMVWHRRRPSLRRYLKQQQGYAKAEALLAAKWPSKYNDAGHLHWHGRLYGRGLLTPLFSAGRIYQGQWGGALFQSVYQPAAGVVSSLPLMPEWYFLVGCTLALGLLGFSWPPLLALLGLGCAGLAVSIAMAGKGAAEASFHGRRSASQLMLLRTIVFGLHLLQPLSRLIGRIKHRLGPWSMKGKRLLPFPRPREKSVWTGGTWRSAEDRLEAITARLRAARLPVSVGGDFDGWDLAITGSPGGSVRMIAMLEEHGGGIQHFRMRCWPVIPSLAVVLIPLLGSLGVAAALDRAPVAAAGLGIASAAIAFVAYLGCATGMAAWLHAFGACWAAELSADQESLGSCHAEARWTGVPGPRNTVQAPDD